MHLRIYLIQKTRLKCIGNTITYVLLLWRLTQNTHIVSHFFVFPQHASQYTLPEKLTETHWCIVERHEYLNSAIGREFECSVLLVMYSWLNCFYDEMNGKHNITLFFFDNNSRCASLLSPCPLVISIDSKCQIKEKVSRNQICTSFKTGLL